jgi:hypothetical protein
MRKLLMSLTLMAAVVILASAAVKTDYDHAADFSRYKTYSWLKVEAGNTLWQDRIRKAVDAELSAKGWQSVPSGGNVAVAAVGSEKTEQRLDTFYNGFGGGWYWHGFGDGVATTTVENIPVGSLVVDLFDAKTKKLVWRATEEKVLSGDPEKNEKKLRGIIGEMFKKFPPTSKG